jgi:hypothetical protein
MTYALSDFAFVMIPPRFLEVFLQRFAADRVFKFNQLIKILIKIAQDSGINSFVFLSSVLSNVPLFQRAHFPAIFSRCIVWQIFRPDGSINTPAISPMRRNYSGLIFAAARYGTDPI